jgi:hypothetical protein
MALGNTHTNVARALGLGVVYLVLFIFFSSALSAQTDQNSKFILEWNKVMGAPTPALSQWQSCLTRFAAKVSEGSSESAELIAQAAFAMCDKQENFAYEGLLDASRVTTNEEVKSTWKAMTPKEIWPAIRKNMHDRVIAAILIAKSKALTEQNDPR